MHQMVHGAQAKVTVLKTKRFQVMFRNIIMNNYQFSMVLDFDLEGS